MAIQITLTPLYETPPVFTPDPQPNFGTTSTTYQASGGPESNNILQGGPDTTQKSGGPDSNNSSTNPIDPVDPSKVNLPAPEWVPPARTEGAYPNKATGDLIAASDFGTLASAVNNEVVRRGRANPGYGTPSGKVSASELNTLWQAIVNAGYSNPAVFNGVSSGAKIYATDIDNLITFVSDAAAVCLCNCNYCTCNCNYCTCDCNYCTCNCNYCTCNCNYCTCNCNYCTCNCNYCTCDCNYACTCNCNYACTCNCNYCTCDCNYSCTCNCNYSDARLKTNIELIGTEGDLNVYSWAYIWNTSKRFFGVMAHELIGTPYESALNKDANGYYYVDYSKLPVAFGEV